MDQEMKQNITEQIRDLEEKKGTYPEGYLVFKTIKNKKQPYLQWNEDGHTKSRYVRERERSEIFLQIEMRAEVERQLEVLYAYREKLGDMWKNYPALDRQSRMHHPVSVGYQSYEQMITKEFFYVDKTMLIRDWWEAPEHVTLINRPRRFGKTLNADMLRCFFSMEYAGRDDLFQSMQIWKYKKYRYLQGTWPVIFLSFAGIKTGDVKGQIADFAMQMEGQYLLHIQNLKQLRDISKEEQGDIESLWFEKMMSSYHALRNREPDSLVHAIPILCEVLHHFYNKKVILIIDEYDTPMQEAWLGGSWEKISDFTRQWFNHALKTNPYLEKAFLTGITRVSSESLFSDLNNLRGYSMTSDRYAEYFGFTEDEVFAALDSQNLKDHAAVKAWYDGFTIGEHKDIYNPWSIVNYLCSGKLEPYWVNTSSNRLLGQLLGKASISVKKQLEMLLHGEPITTEILEDITFSDIEAYKESLWGFLLAAGYVTATEHLPDESYKLRVTNREVQILLEQQIKNWFSGSAGRDYDDMILAMLRGDAELMTECLQEVMDETISFFDHAENFYHGLILGLIQSLKDEYYITSNRESGRGRYDCMLEPKDVNSEKPAIVIEFKIRKEKKEASLEDTVRCALEQIEKKNYVQALLTRGFREDRILRYGIGFDREKEVLVSSLRDGAGGS